MVAVIVALILGLFVLFVGVMGTLFVLERLESRSERRDPKEVLASRFAKGEINEAEYVRAMHVLTYGPPLELPD